MPALPDDQGALTFTTTPNPAAGNVTSWAVPAGERWRIISLSCELVTDANVADRRLMFYLTGGTTAHCITIAHVVQPASLRWLYNFSIGCPESSGEFGFALVVNYVSTPIPDQIHLSIGHGIGILVQNIQAGDQLQTLELFHQRYMSP